MPIALDIDRESLVSFCKREPVRWMGLYGSVLRNDFGPSSDVDILVKLEPDAGVGFIKLMRMQRELSRIVGRRMDLRTPDDLHRRFRERVLQAAEVVCDAENG